MRSMPDEAKGLPPPGIVNRTSIYLGGMGWFTAMLHNALSRRPPMKAGIHRQLLGVTIGWFIGYHVTKYENYTYARLDRDMNSYIALHPEAFPEKEKKTFAEILEPFNPVR